MRRKKPEKPNGFGRIPSRARNSPNATRYVRYCIQHLTEHLGSRLLVEITTQTVATFQLTRVCEKRQQARPSTKRWANSFGLWGKLGTASDLGSQRRRNSSLNSVKTWADR